MIFRLIKKVPVIIIISVFATGCGASDYEWRGHPLSLAQFKEDIGTHIEKSVWNATNVWVGGKERNVRVARFGSKRDLRSFDPYIEIGLVSKVRYLQNDDFGGKIMVTGFDLTELGNKTYIRSDPEEADWFGSYHVGFVDGTREITEIVALKGCGVLFRYQYTPNELGEARNKAAFNGRGRVCLKYNAFEKKYSIDSSGFGGGVQVSRNSDNWRSIYYTAANQNGEGFFDR